MWDLDTARTAGSVSTNVTGTSALVGVIVPLPFIARVQGTACDRLAGQLGSFLKGEDIPRWKPREPESGVGGPVG